MTANAGRWERLAALANSPEEAEAKSARIRRATLAGPGRIRSGQFDAIDVEDLRHLFGLYDAVFFGGRLAAMLVEDRVDGVRFRLSDRLTRAAGKTFRRRIRSGTGRRAAERVEYEIAVSTALLAQAFRDGDRPVVVVGLPCRDRLEALQRVFEHELLHLAEFLAKGRSSCRAQPFRALSRALFGHLASVHELGAPGEAAAEAVSIAVGDLVAFEHGGTTRVGRVSRITKRATVLVEDPAGRAYSDGRRYAAFYVPIARLARAAGPARGPG